MHSHLQWFWRVIVLLGYCAYFVRVVKSGLQPGPNDSDKMVDRVIRVGGGLFILVFFVVVFFIFNPPK